jgi:hypothetical protein
MKTWLALFTSVQVCACGASAFAGGVVAPAPTVNLNVAATNTSVYRGITSNAHVLWTVPLSSVNQDSVNGIILDAQGVLYTPGIGPLSSQTGAVLPPGAMQLSSGAAAIGADGTIYQWEGSTLHAYHSDRTSYWTTRPYDGTSARGVRVAPNGNVYARGLDSNLYVYSPSGTLLWSRPCNQQPRSIPVLDAASNVYFDEGATGVHNAISYDPQGNPRFSVPLNGTSLDQVRLGPDGNIYGREFLNSNFSTTVRSSSTGLLLRQFNSLTNGVQAITPDGTLYSAFLHTVQAQDSNGGVRWSVTLPSDVFVDGWMVADSVGNIFVGTEENQVMAFSATGSPLWTAQLPMTQFQYLQPIIGVDGTIYARSGDNLCAIAGTVPSPGGALVVVLGLGAVTRRRR